MYIYYRYTLNEVLDNWGLTCQVSHEGCIWNNDVDYHKFSPYCIFGWNTDPKHVAVGFPLIVGGQYFQSKNHTWGENNTGKFLNMTKLIKKSPFPYQAAVSKIHLTYIN